MVAIFYVILVFPEWLVLRLHLTSISSSRRIPLSDSRLFSADAGMGGLSGLSQHFWGVSANTGLPPPSTWHDADAFILSRSRKRSCGKSLLCYYKPEMSYVKIAGVVRKSYVLFTRYLNCYIRVNACADMSQIENLTPADQSWRPC